WYEVDNNFYRGFGIVSYGSNHLITDCVISNNYYSGIYSIDSYQEEKMEVVNCIITGNHGLPKGGDYYNSRCITYGGGIMLAGGNLSVTNCTISGNTATIGAGICSYVGTEHTYVSNIDINNSILWDNESIDEPQIVMTGYYSHYYYKGPSTLTVSYSDVQGGEDAVYIDPTDPCCTLSWGPGNIDADPCFIGGMDWEPSVGIISRWEFEEGADSIAYDSAGNNDGTLFGDPNWVAGKTGEYALDFDGEGDYV
ncbi:unnamed protein product, partial [marine sediment metagenome]